MSKAAAAEVARPPSRTIGEILLSRRLVTHVLLEEAVAAQQETGKPLGQILVETGSITRLELASALAEQWGDAGTISPTFPGGSEYLEPAGASDTGVHLAEIRRERRELEARMLELDRGVDAELHGELTAVIEVLGSRLDGLEERLARVQVSADSAPLDELGDALARLAGRFEVVEPELAGLRDVVGASASAAALEHGLAEVAAAIDRVVPRVENAESSSAAAESRMDELSVLVAQALAQLRQSAADTATAQAELAGRVADAPTRVAFEALESALVDLRDSVAEIAGHPAADPTLVDRIGDVARLVGELAARPEVDPTLSARVDELAERLDLGAGTVADAGEADSRVDALIARVAELASRPVGDPEVGERLNRLADSLEELAARPPGDDDLRTHLDELAARVEGLAERSAERLLEDRLDAALSRLDEAAAPSSADAELRARLDALAAALDEVSARPAANPGLEERLILMAGRVDELSDRGTVDPEVEKSLAALAERLEAVSRSASESTVEAAGATSARVEALGARLAELESRPAADGVLERLAELDAAVQALRDARGALSAAEIDEALAQRLRVIDDAAQSLTHELAAATSAWAEDRRDLEARLEWLAARVEAEVSTASQTAAPAPSPEPTGRRAPGTVVQASDGEVEKLRMAVERLMLDFAEHRRALSAAVAGRDLEERVRQLSEDVADLQIAGPTTNGAYPVSGGDGGDRAFVGEARALTRRLDEVEATTVAARDTMLARLERMMGTIDWRLQRLEKPESS